MVHIMYIGRLPSSRVVLVGLPALRFQLLHLLRILLLDPLDRPVPIILHHALLLEVFDLDKQDHLVSISFHYQNERDKTVDAYATPEMCKCTASSQERGVRTQSTYPGRRTRRLKLRNLLPAFPPRLLVVFDTVENIIPVQTGEEEIATFPAPCATCSVWGDAAAVGGFVGVAGRPG